MHSLPTDSQRSLSSLLSLPEMFAYRRLKATPSLVCPPPLMYIICALYRHLKLVDGSSLGVSAVSPGERMSLRHRPERMKIVFDVASMSLIFSHCASS